MLNRLIKFSFLIVAIISFGIFIYPTLYKYDKLDQKYPVMINRITGEAKILTSQGWQNTPQIDSAKNSMIDYRNEIIVKIQDQEDRIYGKVLSAVESELNEIRDQSEANNYINSRESSEDASSFSRHDQFIKSTTNAETFSKGDPMEKVKNIMGTPDRITPTGPYEFWYYGHSMVGFKDGVVQSWANQGDLQVE